MTLKSKSRGPLRRREYDGSSDAKAVIEDMIDDCWRAIRVAFLLLGIMAIAIIKRTK